jgi:dolichol-phosphate mannosyltransferase
MPLTYLSILGLVLSVIAFLGLVMQLVIKVFVPSSAPAGAVSIIVISAFFGSINLLGISVVGEYVGRILEEVRGRPRFISRSLTRNGKEELSQRIDGSS